MNPLADKTYRIIKLLLEETNFGQRQLEQQVPASHAHVSKVLSWLESRKYVEWDDGRYRLLNPADVLTLFAMSRTMEALRRGTYPLSLPPERIVQRLPETSVLCLESALTAYSGYFRSPRVCVYLGDSERIPPEILRSTGRLSELTVYEIDLPLEKDVTTWRGRHITDRVRTLVDLACDSKLYAAKDLLRELYGLRID